MYFNPVQYPDFGIPTSPPRSSFPPSPKENPTVDKTATVAQAAVTGVAQSQAENLKIRFWKVFSDGATWVEDKISMVWANFLEFLDDILSDGEPRSYDRVKNKKLDYQNEQTQNETAIANLSARIKDFDKNTKAVQKLITDFDPSSPEKLLKWLQIPNTLKSTSTPDAIVQSINSKLEQLQKRRGSIKIVPSVDVPTIANPIEQQQKAIDDEKKLAQLEAAFATVLDRQIAELEKLLGDAESLVKKGASEAEAKEKGEGDLLAQWYNQFNQSVGAISNAFSDIQQQTLTALQEMHDRKYVPKNRDELKFCFNYFKIYQALKSQDLIKNLSQPVTFLTKHGDIEKMSTALAAHFDQGIENIGNTCWLNSSIQALRRSPLLELINAPLQRKTGRNGALECDADWADRNRVHQALQKAVYALDFQGPDDVKDAIINLREAMFTVRNAAIVPEELADRNQKNTQHDSALAFRCFLTIIDYQIKLKRYRKFNGVDQKPIEVDELMLMFPPTSTTASIKEFLERSQVGVSKTGEKPVGGKRPIRVNTQNRFAELPQKLVIQVSRFGENEEMKKRLRVHRKKLTALYKDDPSVTREKILAGAELFSGYRHGDITQKQNTKINLRANEILDLRDSYLTADLEDREHALFRLVGATGHIGGGFNGGHYIACCRKPDGSWWEYNDKGVRPLTVGEVNNLVSSHGYQLILDRYTGPMPPPDDEVEADVKVAHEAESKTKADHEGYEEIRDNQSETETDKSKPKTEDKPETTSQNTVSKEGERVEDTVTPPKA